VRAGLLIGFYTAAWIFGGMLKTGGQFPASLREAPWGALIGGVMWLSREWRIRYQSRSDSGAET
jgi:hypothetical protein